MKIVLNFEDGVSRLIDVAASSTLAAAAYRAKINIPLDCNDGVCGTCKCHIQSGDCDMGDYVEDALSEADIEQGLGLACQMKPKTDMVVDILASSTACKVRPNVVPTSIQAIDFLSNEVVRLSVEAPAGHSLGFLAGQYAQVEVPRRGVQRAYSFCNMSDGHTACFLVRLLPSGAMSDYLRSEARVGDTLQLTLPLGGFYVREISKPTLLYAGGTGIAPILAMLEKLSQMKVKYPIQLFYGASKAANLVELERLEALKARLPLTYKTCVSDEPSAEHPSGLVTQWIRPEVLGNKNYDAYVCGPPAMVDAVKAAFAAQKIRIIQFYTEKFTPA